MREFNHVLIIINLFMVGFIIVAYEKYLDKWVKYSRKKVYSDIKDILDNDIKNNSKNKEGDNNV